MAGRAQKAASRNSVFACSLHWRHSESAFFPFLLCFASAKPLFLSFFVVFFGVVLGGGVGGGGGWGEEGP